MLRDPSRNGAQSLSLRAHRGQTSKNCCTRGQYTQTDKKKRQFETEFHISVTDLDGRSSKNSFLWWCSGSTRWPEAWKGAQVRHCGLTVTQFRCHYFLYIVSAVSLLISGNTFYQPGCLLGDMDNIHSANGNLEPGDKRVIGMAASEGQAQNLNSRSPRLSPPFVARETSKEVTAKAETINNVSPSILPSPSPAPDRLEDQNNNNQSRSSPAHGSVGQASPSPSPPAPTPLPKVGLVI